MRVAILICIIVIGLLWDSILFGRVKGCRSPRYVFENRTPEWTEMDAKVLQRYTDKCMEDYGTCIVLFRKNDFQDYTVLCVNRRTNEPTTEIFDTSR